MDFLQRVEDNRRLIDDIIAAQLLPYRHERLYEVMSYSLFAGGKRLRPMLLLETLRMLAVDRRDETEKLMTAVECLHTYTLIHDDLPCMDDDDYRRGRPSCHKKYGEAAALLAGDGLLNICYELILKACVTGDKSIVSAGNILAGLAGVSGVVGGQALELSLPKDKEAFRANIDEIYFKKTAYLLAAPVVMGMVAAGAPATAIAPMTDFANAFGYSFQLLDDLDDLVEKGESKLSYVWVYGREQTEATAKANLNAAKAALQKSGCDTSFFTALCDNSLKRLPL